MNRKVRVVKRKFNNNLKKLLILVILAGTCFVAYKKIDFKFKKNKDIESSIVRYTVDDKVYGMPYINPEWEKYMQLTDEEKEEIEVIPDQYIYNYIPEENLYGDYSNLPSRFKLTDDYPITIYDQGSEGLCWAYATASMLEANLKYTKNINEQFSAQQLSRISSMGLYNLNHNYGTGLGYTQHTGFYNSILSSGMVPMRLSDYTATGENGKYTTSDIINKDKIKYQVTQTTSFPIYESTTEYINMIKSYIKKYGAIYVGISAPMGGCYNESLNLIYYQREYEKCEALGHAMIIIGWDDNYGSDIDEDGKADGAWILQNSYGDYRTNPYLSYKSEIPILYGVKEVVDKTWDNNYDMSQSPTVELDGVEIEQIKSFYEDDNFSALQNRNSLLQTTAVKGILEVTYHKQYNNEKLQTIEFASGSQNGTYSVYVSPDGTKNNYQLVDTIETDLPGVYSVDCNNLELNNNLFTIKIVTTNGVTYTQVNAFTKNNGKNDNEIIEVDVDDGIEDNDRNITYHFYATSKNVDKSIPIIITIKNEEKETISTLKVKEEDFLGDFAVKNYEANPNTKKGSKLYAEVTYNDQIVKTLEITYNHGYEEGSGTIDDPYVIKTKRDFEYMNQLEDAYFILNNDIDLKDEPIKSIAHTKYNLRIQNIKGHLNGNGHAIKNVYIKVDEINEQKLGIFNKVSDSVIENIRFENVTIEGPYYTSAGKYGLVASEIKNSTLNNIYVSGRVTANQKGEAGLIAAKADNVKISNFYVVGSIEHANGNVGGLFGDITNYEDIGDNDIGNSIENGVIVGNIYGLNRYHYEESSLGGVIGTIYESKIKIKNVNIIDNFKIENLDDRYVEGKKPYSVKTLIGTIVGYNKSNSQIDIQNVRVTDNYCDDNECTNNIEDAIKLDKITDFKSINLSTYNLDNNLWEKKSSNNLPTLKYFENIYVSSINQEDLILKERKNKTLTISIEPENASFKDYDLEIEDETIAKLNENKIEGIKAGETYLTINSKDGSNVSKKVKITVQSGQRDVTIIYSYMDQRKTIKNSYEIGEEITLPTQNELETPENIWLYGFAYNGDDSKIYLPGEKFIVPENDISFSAEYRINPAPEIETKYDIDEENKIIKNVCYTRIEKYLENLVLPRGYEALAYDNEGNLVTDGYIGTTYITKIFDNSGLEVARYTNSVLGDANGNAKIQTRDVSFILQYVVGLRKVDKNDPRYLAMDFNKDGEIKINDARAIQYTVVKNYKYFEEVCPGVWNEEKEDFVG